MISEKFKISIKLNPKRQYELAWEAGVHPVVLSQIVTGYIRAKYGDPRVIKVGALLGLNPEECFEGPGKSSSVDCYQEATR